VSFPNELLKTFAQDHSARSCLPRPSLAPHPTEASEIPETSKLQHIKTFTGLGTATDHIAGLSLCKIFVEEIKQILDTCRGDVRDMILLTLGSGTRASAVLGLDRDHLDMKNNLAILRDTKNGDRRIVPLPSQVIEMLAHRPALLPELFAGWPPDRLTTNGISRYLS
jgi:Phage integrase family